VITHAASNMPVPYPSLKLKLYFGIGNKKYALQFVMQRVL